MGETRVDLQHLLEDLRDAYPGSLEETILTEVIANSLDSGATRLDLHTVPGQGAVTIRDNGSGMSRAVLRRYHDIASSTKQRGEGIGFAGVGIKLGLLLSEEVLTETRRGATHVATSWRLATRQRAPWHWVPPSDLVAEHGTALLLKLHNPLSPLADAAFLEAAVRRHFSPLLDPAFADVLRERYPAGVAFYINGAPVLRAPEEPGRVPLQLRFGRRRRPGAVGYLYRSVEALPEDARGIAVSALGKVIKQGWDWLGLTPSDADRIGGLIEVPPLAECLTLNKADFLRSGPRGAAFLSYRRALQEAVAGQLAAWGAQPEEAQDERLRRRARPVERDLRNVLTDLAEQFPMLASLVEHHPGGQRALPVGKPGPGITPGAAPAEVQPALDELALAHPGTAPADAPPAIDPPDPPENDPPEPALLATPPGRRGPRRPTRYGLSIQFESRPDDSALGRLAEATVWVNDAHPAYRRASATRAEGYHLALTVALVLAPLAVEPAQTQDFISAFLRHWGESAGRS